MTTKQKHTYRIFGKPAFTLIELLVVIAIIALLVSILLPSLNKAKDLARRAVCSTNQKSLGIAMSMYSNEWNGFLPAYNKGARPGVTYDIKYKGYWTNALAEYQPVTEWDNEDYGYMKMSDSDAWTCPSLEKSNYWQGGGYGVLYQREGTGGLIFHTGDWRAEDTLSHAGSTLMLTDSRYTDSGGGLSCLIVSRPRGDGSGMFTMGFKPSPRHGGSEDGSNYFEGGGNVLFADRHVEYRNITDLIDNQENMFDPDN